MSYESNIMEQWDYWRKRISSGDTSSSPRDWFENLLEMYEDDLNSLRKELSEVKNELNKYKKLL